MNAPGESPGAYFLKNMTGIIRTILDNQRKVTLYEFALREIVCRKYNKRRKATHRIG